MTTSFECPTCGRSHAGLPTDRGYTLPDDVWALPVDERARKARWNADLCEFGRRHFIRGLLRVPFAAQPGYFGWGVWVEVALSDFRRYVELYAVDASAEPAIDAHLANRLPLYEALGEPVRVQFGAGSARPVIALLPGSNSRLARHQADGISDLQYHEVLVAIGVIPPGPMDSRTDR